MKYVSTVAVLNVRNNPSLNADIINKLYLGEAISFLQQDISGLWIQGKKNDGSIGWSYKQFLKEVKEDAPKPVENKITTETYFDGNAVYNKYNRTFGKRNVTFHTITTNIQKFEFVLDSKPNKMSVPNWVKLTGVNFAVNGDGWNWYTNIPSGENAYRGNVYGRTGFEETLWISKDNKFSFMKRYPVWNGLGFPNRLVMNGAVSTRLNKPEYDYRARTAMGWNKDQSKFMMFVSDGGDYSASDGLNFREVATLLVEFGCWEGIMNDGGGSSQMVLNTDGNIRLVSKSAGENPDGTRSVINRVGLKWKG